jgi:hypothetical protein
MIQLVVGVPQQIAEVFDIHPWNRRVGFRFPLFRDLLRGFAENLQVPFEGGLDGRVRVHRVKRTSIKQFPDVRNGP